MEHTEEILEIVREIREDVSYMKLTAQSAEPELSRKRRSYGHCRVGYCPVTDFIGLYPD